MDLLVGSVVTARKLTQQRIELAILFVIVLNKNVVHNFVQEGNFQLLKALISLIIVGFINYEFSQ